MLRFCVLVLALSSCSKTLVANVSDTKWEHIVYLQHLVLETGEAEEAYVPSSARIVSCHPDIEYDFFEEEWEMETHCEYEEWVWRTKDTFIHRGDDLKELSWPKVAIVKNQRTLQEHKYIVVFNKDNKQWKYTTERLDQALVFKNNDMWEIKVNWFGVYPKERVEAEVN